MQEQGTKLMGIIGRTINSLTRLEEVLPAIQALGQRHVNYGVRDQHYDTVAQALIWTLEKGLGAAFTPDAKQAWTHAYGLLADAMKAASRA
jgi:hemoglobin-like flavoprotein